MLKVEGLTKYYGDTLGVKDLSLELKRGEVFGFIGPNGAGKSTTIRAIMNLINKDSGKVFIDDVEFTKNNYDLKQKIGYLPSEINLYEDMTVMQLFNLHASFYKKNTIKRRRELVKKLNINEKVRISKLSLGTKKKVAIVLALMHEPELVIFDEPTSGLDPVAQHTFYAIVADLKKQGTTILYSSHILPEIERLCDRVGIIKDGVLIKVEKIRTLKNKNLSYVSVFSKSIINISKDLDLYEYMVDRNMLRFKVTGNYDNLIKVISKYKIDKILIEEASLEDLFLHYYE